MLQKMLYFHQYTHIIPQRKEGISYLSKLDIGRNLATHRLLMGALNDGTVAVTMD